MWFKSAFQYESHLLYWVTVSLWEVWTVCYIYCEHMQKNDFIIEHSHATYLVFLCMCKFKIFPLLLWWWMNNNTAYVNLIYHQTIFQCPNVFRSVVTGTDCGLLSNMTHIAPINSFTSPVIAYPGRLSLQHFQFCLWVPLWISRKTVNSDICG